MEQPTPKPTELVAASTAGSSQGTTACTTAEQANGCMDGDGEGEGGRPSAVEATSVDKDVLEMKTGGDAAAVATGGQAHERKKRPPRVGSVRQGRKEKRKAEWKAKKARMKETKVLERQQR